MPSTGAARARTKEDRRLTYWEAIQILNSMPYLVCACGQKLLNSQVKRRHHEKTVRILPEIYEVEFEVSNGDRTYKFPKQPFRVLAVITRAEFKRVAPWAACGDKYFYRIATD